MPRVGIALGSNLGNRLDNLRAAKAALREISTSDKPFLEGSIYESEPSQCPANSPLFYNTVVEIHFEGSAFELLEITQSIEKKLGRMKALERNSPRIIDIDLLYFGEEVIATESLVLPHPRIQERRFVLQPLAEICPDKLLPSQTVNIVEMLIQLLPSEPPLHVVARR